MKRIPAAGPRKRFALLVTRCHAGQRIKVTRYDKAVVMLSDKRDLELLELLAGSAHEPGGGKPSGGLN
jgi:hypothetical protein